MSRLCVVAGVIIALAGCTQSSVRTASSSPPAASSRVKAGAKQLCRDVRVMASNRVTRVCRSKSEWDRIDEQS